MIDQLIIGDKASYDDFEASVKERTITDGKKKEIKDSVPFSNVTYDFSAINGEIYWEEKKLEYVFEITANTPEELEEKKMAFKSWVMNVMGEKLYDPFILDYHFIATYSDIDVDDSEIEKATITVTFTAYPYMIANKAKVYTIEFGEPPSGDAAVPLVEVAVTVNNDSSHRITPTFNSAVDFIVAKDGSSYSVPSGETTDESFKLDVGKNTLTIQAAQGSTVNISFCEEVF